MTDQATATATAGAVLTIFHAGKELENSATWQNRQMLGNALVALLGAAPVIAHMFGVTINLTADQITIIGSGLAAFYGLANSVLTVITSSRIGITPRPPKSPAIGQPRPAFNCTCRLTPAEEGSDVQNIAIVMHDPTQKP